MKRLPLALVIGLAIQVLYDSIRVYHYATMSADAIGSWETWGLFEEGADVASTALIMLGLFDLSRGLAGPAARGARIAAWAQVGTLVVFAMFLVISAWTATGHVWGGAIKDINLVTRYLLPLAMLATSIGVWMASRQLVLGIATVAVTIVGTPIPPLGEAIGHLVDPGQTVGFLMTMLPYAVLSILWLVQLAVGTRDLAMPPPTVPATLAFSRAASALWLRLIATCSLAGLTLFAALSGGVGLMDLLKGVTLLSPLVDAFALVLFARAALQLGRAGISPWRTTLASACALFATGMILTRITTTYELLYGHHSSFGERDGALMTYSIALPLVVGTAITLVLLAVTQLARERNADDVRENVSIRTGVFVFLTLGSLFIATWGTTHLAHSAGSVMFMLLCLVGAAFYTLVLAAKICALGAELVDRDPRGLPSATLIDRGGA